jgi:hypothetical protein
MPVDALDPSRGQAYAHAMRRLLTSLVLGYVVLAACPVLQGGEAAGLMTSDCYPDCRCRRPGLSVFRWVFPSLHHNPGLEARGKRQLGSE